MYLLTALIVFTFYFISERLSIHNYRKIYDGYFNYGPGYEAYPYYFDYGSSGYYPTGLSSTYSNKYYLTWKRNRANKTISVYANANYLPKGLQKEEYRKLNKYKRRGEWILVKTIQFEEDPLIVPFIEREEEFVKTLGNKFYGVVLYNYKLIPLDEFDSVMNYVVTTGTTKCVMQRALYDKSINRPYVLKVLDNLTKEEKWNLTIDELATEDYGFYKVIKTGKANTCRDGCVNEGDKGVEKYERITFAEFVKWGGFDLSVYKNPDDQHVRVTFYDDPKIVDECYEHKIFGQWLFEKYLVFNDCGEFVIDDKALYNDLVNAGWEE